MLGFKPVEFRGSALEDRRAFPTTARREAGYQIDRVQRGRDPDDWKAMKSVGPGVREIRVRDTAGTFGVVFVAAFPDVVYVLHSFQKKSLRTSKTDIDLAAKRYRDLRRDLGR
jgi:phage-related protein